MYMNYCKFENVAIDLQRVLEALSTEDPIDWSLSERKGAIAILRLIHDFVEDEGDGGFEIGDFVERISDPEGYRQ